MKNIIDDFINSNTQTRLCLMYRGVKDLKEIIDILEKNNCIDKLKELDLGNNGLKELPKEIGKLKNLKVLYLENNEISELPEEIGELENLELLHLKGNNIQDLNKEIIKLKNLKFINF